uniref:Mutant beta-globin n=1 Tax=Homo sapiens TaxID=9606 RepID=Q9Y6D8_HUMAN|nr:mutant beta-globin [Homo sapiens]
MVHLTPEEKSALLPCGAR